MYLLLLEAKEYSLKLSNLFYLTSKGLGDGLTVDCLPPNFDIAFVDH
jgi:hypothetical protein